MRAGACCNSTRKLRPEIGAERTRRPVKAGRGRPKGKP